MRSEGGNDVGDEKDELHLDEGLRTNEQGLLRVASERLFSRTVVL